MEVYTGQKGGLCGVGMYPAQGNEVVLVLHQKQLFFILCVTVIWTPALFRHNHVRHRKSVPVQSPTENPTGFHRSYGVVIGQPQEFAA